ncbi:MAG: PD40 domain-containing protein [Planctomycetes bacterium]|nr:PD40 domain-containing protein [Planctomycetota bacterium]
MNPRTVALYSAGLAAFLAAAASGQTTTRISVDSSGTEGDGPSSYLAITPDGRYVAFESLATNLVAGDVNDLEDVFVHDFQTGVTTLESVSTNGTQGNGASWGPALSADGRFLAFTSAATNLVSGDTNSKFDVFLRDRQDSTTIRVSVSSSNAQGNKESLNASITSDGRWIAFDSAASNLAPNASPTDLLHEIFVRDLVANQTTLVSTDGGGTKANGQSIAPAIAANGRYVAYASLAFNLAPGKAQAGYDVYVNDLETGATERISADSAGNAGAAESFAAAISADGRFVAFQSKASNLVTGDTNSLLDVFVRDRQTSVTERVSVGPAGVQGNAQSSAPSISADGRYVAFESLAFNLVASDGTASADVYLRDRLANATTLLSVDYADVQGDAASQHAVVSGSGRFVGFGSRAANLVADDVNGASDIFIRDRVQCDAGTVNSGAGPIADVLTINGGTGIVTAPERTPIVFALAAAPAGPDPANYAFFVWRSPPTQQWDLVWSGDTLGCTVNPTPFQAGAAPQPYRCLSGGMDPAFCSMITGSPHAPPTAPWSVTKQHGLSAGRSLTVQAVISDAAAGNPSGLSVTNAVIIKTN